MATRQETQNKRRQMREEIIESCRSGRVGEGELFPTVRELARQYGLSVNLASEVVQSLVAEGVLHARPGVGVMAGNPRPQSPGTYLFLLPERVSREEAAIGYVGATQRGFEVAITQLGGACLTLEAEQARQYTVSDQLPHLSGVFSIDPAAAREFLSEGRIYRASFGEMLVAQSPPDAPSLDAICFDNFCGGQQATQHLLAAQYESIAFLAMHSVEEEPDLNWSALREAGWRDAMTQAKKAHEGMAFHPPHAPLLNSPRSGPYIHGGEQMDAAREAVTPLLALIRGGHITAVVAANFFAARTLFSMLQEAFIAPKLWPAVVCFDSFDGLDNHVVSALNLPWDEVGKAGAQVLWERSVGRLTGVSVVRPVPMQLIQRLTSRPDWMQSSGLILPQLEMLALPRPSVNLTPAPV